MKWEIILRRVVRVRATNLVRTMHTIDMNWLRMAIANTISYWQRHGNTNVTIFRPISVICFVKWRRHKENRRSIAFKYIKLRITKRFTLHRSFRRLSIFLLSFLALSLSPLFDVFFFVFQSRVELWWNSFGHLASKSDVRCAYCSMLSACVII